MTEPARIELRCLLRLDEHTAIYNVSVDRFLEAAEALKQEVVGGDAGPIHSELIRAEKAKIRHSDAISNRVSELQRLRQEKRATEKLKDDTRQQLEAHANDVLLSLSTSVNKLLDDFRADFHVDKVTYSQLGGTAKAHWTIVLREKIIDPVSREGRPTLRTALSDGDRRTLALAYFLARVLSDPDRANAIVLLDDPMSSLDEGRRSATRKTIAKLFREVRQVIVCSHDRDFLFQVRRTIEAEGRDSGKPLQEAEWTALQFKRVKGDNSVVVPLDLEVECRQDYERRYHQVMSFSEGESELEPRAIVVELRPFLERFLQYRFLADLADADTLGKMLESLRKDHPEWYESDEGIQWVALNEDLARFHHDTAPDAEQRLGQVQDSEARALARRCLALIQHLPDA